MPASTQLINEHSVELMLLQAPFTLGVVANNENGDTKSSVECGSVVMATGLDESHAPPSVQGIEHTIGYEDLPQTGEAFEDQAVAVLGFGNAAFETASARHGPRAHVASGLCPCICVSMCRCCCVLARRACCVVCGVR